MTATPVLPVNQKRRILVLRLVFVAALPLILFVQPRIPIGTFQHEAIEAVGLGLLLIGVLGRLWSILYVGSVKNRELMRSGPYSMTRNPLYVFSTIGMTGIGLMLGAVFFAVLLGGLTFAILYVTASREAGFLRATFGDAYTDYAREVPFFWPDPRLYKSTDSVTFSSRALRNTLFDALGFLAAIPVVELIDAAKTSMDLVLFTVF
ncbi:methyltransferase family protein [Roseicyclus marinus]|uniref:methyltransferase family protein n=1 Tax=Roseicyclus marinus TaxID=2161673 RepID=UPI00240F90D2|nr:isoprenylcysteine carboxylmethyltransferase family protein [Roseicyclus marinus]MDG3039707.1 isoprenylcysteine carboxylmethyltransferase family protein [Roseicyclus marinus]